MKKLWKQYNDRKNKHIIGGAKMTNSVTIHSNGDSHLSTASITLRTPGESSSLYLTPTWINFPVLNTNVKIPVNDSTSTIEQAYEKGVDFLADLLELDGVKEVLEKHGVEITPL